MTLNVSTMKNTLVDQTPTPSRFLGTFLDRFEDVLLPDELPSPHKNSPKPSAFSSNPFDVAFRKAKLTSPKIPSLHDDSSHSPLNTPSLPLTTPNDGLLVMADAAALCAQSEPIQTPLQTPIQTPIHNEAAKCVAATLNGNRQSVICTSKPVQSMEKKPEPKTAEKKEATIAPKLNFKLLVLPQVNSNIAPNTIIVANQTQLSALPKINNIANLSASSSVKVEESRKTSMLTRLKPGRKQKGAPAEDPNQRKVRCLERNRAAAMRCRQKRKQWIDNLEEKARDLQAVNERLQREIECLRGEVSQLKTALLAHKDCPVTKSLQEQQTNNTEQS